MVSLRRLARARPGGARLFALALHRVVERREIDADAARAQRVLREIERKAISVVEREGGLAVEHVALCQARALLVEDREAALQRVAEAGLFQLERLGDQRLGADQLGIGLAHLARERGHQLPHQRFFGAEQFGMAHGAPHDAAEHIAAAFVRGQHAVGDQEGRRAQVIGDHPVRGLVRPMGADPGQLRDVLDQIGEQVDGVIVVRALQHRGDAFEPHAGVDRGPRQVDALAALELLVLHEDEIPDLDEAVAVGIGRAGRAAGDVVAVVVEDFRARTAGAGVAHRPEIVAAGDAEDALSGRPAIFFQSLKASSSSI